MKKALILLLVFPIICVSISVSHSASYRAKTYEGAETMHSIHLPAADGYYDYMQRCVALPFGETSCYSSSGIVPHKIKVGSDAYGDMYNPPYYAQYHEKYTGIMEFNVSSIDGLFASGQMQAVLSLTVKADELPSDSCLFLYSIQDVNENGIIEEVDIDTEDYIAEVCADLQLGDTIIFDVTTAIEHDLYDPDQTDFSGFVINRSTDYAIIGRG